MAVRTVVRIRLARGDVRSRYSDSGVVMSTCGGWRSIAWRSAWDVSPDRTARVNSGSGAPDTSDSARTPSSGTSRLRWMSFPSARSGEM